MNPSPQSAPPEQTAIPLSIRANFSWTLTGNGVYAGSKWLTVIALAKLASPDIVGAYVLGIAVCTPLMMLTDLHLRTIQATDAQRRHRFSDYIRLRCVSVLAGWLAIGIIAVAFYPGLRTVILCVALMKGAESVGDIFYGLFQQRERMDRVARSMMIKGVLAVSMLTATYIWTQRLTTAVLAVAASYLAVIAAYDLPAARLLMRVDEHHAVSADTRWRELGTLAWVALPMGIVTMLNSLYANIPRYVIEYVEGSAALGIFAALAYLVQLGSLFVSSMGQSISPRLSQLFLAGEFRIMRVMILRLLGVVLVLAMAALAMATVAGEWVLHLLYGEEYAAESITFTWLMVVAGLSFFGSVLGVAVTAMRKFRIQALIHTVSLLLILGLSLPLVRHYGLKGAAMALLVSTTAVVVMYGIVTVSALRQQPPNRAQE